MSKEHAHDHELHRWEEEGGAPSPLRRLDGTDGTEASPFPAYDAVEPRPFEKAVFEALSFEAEQVRKVDVSIGPRSQSVTFKFALTTEQVEQLNAMASVR